MARIDIWELVITEERADHMWERHHVDAESVRELPDSRYVVVANRNQRVASHLIIGTDAQGRCLTAPIRRTHNPHVWEVITAWPCGKSEAAKLRRRP
jgi:hypothetical protein